MYNYVGEVLPTNVGAYVCEIKNCKQDCHFYPNSLSRKNNCCYGNSGIRELHHTLHQLYCNLHPSSHSTLRHTHTHTDTHTITLHLSWSYIPECPVAQRQHSGPLSHQFAVHGIVVLRYRGVHLPQYLWCSLHCG